MRYARREVEPTRDPGVPAELFGPAVVEDWCDPGRERPPGEWGADARSWHMVVARRRQRDARRVWLRNNAPPESTYGELFGPDGRARWRDPPT